jgi:hypothetical protein
MEALADNPDPMDFILDDETQEETLVLDALEFSHLLSSPAEIFRSVNLRYAS